ncbi:molybdenum ABC transporter ATP-binding protein [Desulfotalea psychrophila]|uniref:Probable molybdenum ABC-transporter, ATP-binding protein (ModC) n=1 Tax=Desulfotalea psychrophila (strain LSv54 / DSM 12343) TaxID=177439 RepID=Q6AR40_DESPS|nr:molybdenum ABC transporter ATP-binding protein [Desulfotalea psychrophila]CAG35184.1 probable molybdenum ABC-transporter, ATP-binding protein (ModC) [Desulfotalea psychrophila LSv54]
MTILARFLVEREGFSLDVDLKFPARGLTALVGPSGCGKTTLLRAIAGLERFESGFLQVGNLLWQDRDSFVPAHKRSIGYVFQEPRLFPHLSVRRNVEYGLRRRRADRQTLHQAVELLQIGHLLDRSIAGLSGGEQQRVGIARALAARPTMLLMDEPLAALDMAHKQEIIPYLQSLHRQLEIPVLYVSHSADEVMRLADHLLILDEGRLQANGPMQELSHLLYPSSGGYRNVFPVHVLHSSEPGLCLFSSAAGIFTLPHQGLAEGRELRLQVLARDVLLCFQKPGEGSVLNAFPARVVELRPSLPGLCLICLQVGDLSLYSEVAEKVSVGLQFGSELYVQINHVEIVG